MKIIILCFSVCTGSTVIHCLLYLSYVGLYLNYRPMIFHFSSYQEAVQNTAADAARVRPILVFNYSSQLNSRFYKLIQVKGLNDAPTSLPTPIYQSFDIFYFDYRIPPPPTTWRPI